MSFVARQSTARTLMIGPVLDADGVAVTGGVVGDFKVSKNGAAPGALDGSATATHRHTGHYSLALTANDLDTVGTAQITIDDTTNSCSTLDIQVVEEVIFDAIYAASANAFAGAAGATTLGSGAITAAVVATGAIDADAIATDAITDAKVAADVTIASVTGAVGSVTGNVGGSVGSVIGAVGSVTGLTASNLDAAVSSRMATYAQPAGFLAATFPTDPADQSIIIAATDAIIAAVAALNNLSSEQVTAAVPTAAQIFTAVLTSQLTEAYAADGTAPTLAQAIFLIQQSLHEFAIVSTTRTVKKLDGSTTAATFTLDSATTPTSTTRAS